jgi:beta-phosphoglucomutase family hydrolase
MEAVIFDLDGTIVFSHPTHFAAYEKLFGEFGITWSFEEFEKVFAGTGAPAIIEQILERNGVSGFDLPALVKKKRDIFNEILAHKKLEVVPGFFEFLKEVNRLGLKKIIASGSNKANIRAMLENIGVSEDFPIVVSGEEVARPKPAPDIFLAAAQKIGVEPAQCLVIEDTDHGVRAARAAGMKCIAFTTTLPAVILKKAEPDSIAKDYHEILTQKNFGLHL